MTGTYKMSTFSEGHVTRIGIPEHHGKIVEDALPDGVRFTIHPPGLASAKGHLFFGAVWNGILLLIVVVSILNGPAQWKFDAGTIVPVGLFALFAMIGMLVLLNAAWLARRRGSITVTGGRLKIIEQGIISTKRHDWPLEEIESVQVAFVALAAPENGVPPNPEGVLLKVYLRDESEVSRFHNLPTKDLEWIAKSVSAAIRPHVAIDEQTREAAWTMIAKSLPATKVNLTALGQSATAPADLEQSGESPSPNRDAGQLPHWARVIFLAQCARRIQSVVRTIWPEATRKQRAMIEEAICLAEDSAGLGRPLAEARSIGKQVRAMAEGNEVSRLIADILAATAHAVDADPSRSAASVATIFDQVPKLAMEISDESMIATMHQDFDWLARKSRKAGWSDATPVPMAVFVNRLSRRRRCKSDSTSVKDSVGADGEATASRTGKTRPILAPLPTRPLTGVESVLRILRGILGGGWGAFLGGFSALIFWHFIVHEPVGDGNHLLSGLLGMLGGGILGISLAVHDRGPRLQNFILTICVRGALLGGGGSFCQLAFRQEQSFAQALFLVWGLGILVIASLVIILEVWDPRTTAIKVPAAARRMTQWLGGCVYAPFCVSILLLGVYRSGDHRVTLHRDGPHQEIQGELLIHDWLGQVLVERTVFRGVQGTRTVMDRPDGRQGIAVITTNGEYFIEGDEALIGSLCAELPRELPEYLKDGRPTLVVVDTSPFVRVAFGIHFLGAVGIALVGLKIDPCFPWGKKIWLGFPSDD